MDDKSENIPDKTGKEQGKQANSTSFKPGESGNPNGRPKGAKNYLTQLEEALKEEAKKANKTYWQKLAEWCFTNPSMAIAVLKKFIPDKTHTEIEGVGDTEIIILNARESFRKKLDDIAKRLNEIGKKTSKQNGSNIGKTADGGKK